MVIEDLKEDYPLLYQEAIKVYEEQNVHNTYKPGVNIMNIAWDRTDDSDFWCYVYELYNKGNLEKCKVKRPELFTKPIEVKGAIISNNGLFN